MDVETKLIILVFLLKFKVHILKVTMVITLAPHEVHPCHSTDRTYLPSWRFYRNRVGASCLGPCRLSLVFPHLKIPILNLFYDLLWFYLLTVSEFSCLALLAKPYPVSGLTSVPQIPHQLHLIQKSAHEVLGAILVA